MSEDRKIKLMNLIQKQGIKVDTTFMYDNKNITIVFNDKKYDFMFKNIKKYFPILVEYEEIINLDKTEYKSKLSTEFLDLFQEYVEYDSKTPIILNINSTNLENAIGPFAEILKKYLPESPRQYFTIESCAEYISNRIQALKKLTDCANFVGCESLCSVLLMAIAKEIEKIPNPSLITQI
jgi:hypothetical protein